jgi:hypothetical protein
VGRINVKEAAMLGRAQKSAALHMIAMVKRRDIAWSKDRYNRALCLFIPTINFITFYLLKLPRDAVDRLVATYASDEERRKELMDRVEAIAQKQKLYPPNNTSTGPSRIDMDTNTSTPAPVVVLETPPAAIDCPPPQPPSSPPRAQGRQSRVCSVLEQRRATMIAAYLIQRRNQSKIEDTKKDPMDELLRLEIERNEGGIDEHDVPESAMPADGKQRQNGGPLFSPERNHDAFSTTVVLGIKEKLVCFASTYVSCIIK